MHIKRKHAYFGDWLNGEQKSQNNLGHLDDNDDTISREHPTPDAYWIEFLGSWVVVGGTSSSMVTS
jgi:hypothetical protein